MPENPLHALTAGVPLVNLRWRSAALPWQVVLAYMPGLFLDLVLYHLHSVSVEIALSNGLRASFLRRPLKRRSTIVVRRAIRSHVHRALPFLLFDLLKDLSPELGVGHCVACFVPSDKKCQLRSNIDFARL